VAREGVLHSLLPAYQNRYLGGCFLKNIQDFQNDMPLDYKVLYIYYTRT
jgi:hypothetical protein